MNKTLSLALTTYNGGLYLREQLESIYNQTKVPDEIVVCDDGSTDETISILEEYKVKRGLKYFVNNPRLGVNRNFYKAISLCSCDYIALSDQDDIWLPNKIEITYNKLRELDNDIPIVISSQAIDVDKDCNCIGQKDDIVDSDEFYQTFLKYDNSQGCSLMFNKLTKDLVLSTCNCVADYMCFDVYIAYVAALRGVKYNIGKRLMYYRHHQNNVIGKISQRKMSFIEHIRVQHRFRHFMIEKQMEYSLCVYNLHKENIYDDSIHHFFDKIQKIYYSDNKMYCYWIIFSMAELSLIQKTQIVFQTIIIDLLRIFIK